MRRPPPHKEEVKCLKIGERAQTLTVKQPSRHQEAGGQWDVQENPWSRSSQAVGSHHQAPFGSDSLGRVDLRSERERKERDIQRICEESSKEETSQCFLITPKLQGGILDNVGRHITVLNIFKGRDMVNSSSKAPARRGRFV